MKLQFNIPVLLMALSAMFSSCNKFLDEPQRSGTSLISNVANCQQILDAQPMYRSGHITDDLRSSDDYYLTDEDYNALSGDIKRDLYVWKPDAIRTDAEEWQSVYNKIYTTNVALESLDKITRNNPGINKEGDDYKLAKGMALFLRGTCLHRVVIAYAKPYDVATSGQDPGVPVKLTSDINSKAERGTVQQTYDRIVQDLKEAADLLPNTTPAPTRPNKAAAYGMLARVYLTMGQISLAGAAANSSLQLKKDLMDYNDLDQGTGNPYPKFNKEILYYSDTFNTLEDGDNIIKIVDELITQYPANDLRKPVFFRETSYGSGVYVYKGNYSSEICYFNGLATDEVYLIRAECYARTGNIEAAMDDLNTLLKARWKKDTYVNMTAANADDALSKVLKERRKELVMRLLRWSDLKRLNKNPNTAKTLKRTVLGVEYTLPPNDLRYQLLIPQPVIQYGGLPQNPRN